MKLRPLLVALLVSLVAFGDTAVIRGSLNSASRAWSASAQRYGPKHCVLIERAPSGSCLIRTDCHGQDTSSLEFAFDCWSSNGDIYRHSYGSGGFAEREDFDTEVQCAQCHAPSPVITKPISTETVAAPVAAAAVMETQHPLAPVFSPSARAKSIIKATEGRGSNTRPRVMGSLSDRAAADRQTSRYGPSSCVSTWRNGAGHCVVQTDCANVDISSYEFGMICVDERGVKTRHTFGRGSFDAAETFDTLAACTECLGLEDPRVLEQKLQKRQWQRSTDANEVAILSKEVKTLTQGMTMMLASVMKLRQKVEAKKVTTPSPSMVATVAAWGGDDSETVESSPRSLTSMESQPRAARTAMMPSGSMPEVVVHEVRHHKRRHHHHHHQRHHHKKNIMLRVRGSDEDSGGDHKSEGTQSVPARSTKDDDSSSVETVSASLSSLENINAEDSELEVASAGVAAEIPGAGWGNTESELPGSLDDGSSILQAAW